MSPVGFEPTISAGERPQTDALDRAATGTGLSRFNTNKLCYGGFRFFGVKCTSLYLPVQMTCGRGLEAQFRTVRQT